MASTLTSAALVPVTPVFSNTERLALAGYSGLTRQAYELDLRQYASWCSQHQLCLFAARRADIECFARDLEARGRPRATITRRLCPGGGVLPVRLITGGRPRRHGREQHRRSQEHGIIQVGGELADAGLLAVAVGDREAVEQMTSILAVNWPRPAR